MVPNPADATADENEANEVASLLSTSSKLQCMLYAIALPNALTNAPINEKPKDLYPSEPLTKAVAELSHGW